MRIPKVVSSLLRILLSLLVLAILIRQVGGQGVVAALREADPGLLVLSWVLFLLGVVIRVLRWRALLHGLGRRPPFGLLLKLYLIGGFFNAFLPSGFGGDVVRVLELGRGEGNGPADGVSGPADGTRAPADGTRAPADEAGVPTDGATDGHAPENVANGLTSGASAALGTVLVDRLTGILSLMAMGLVVLPFARELTTWTRWVFAAIAGTGLAGGALLLQGHLLRRLTARLPNRLSLTGDGKLAQIYAAVTGSGPRAVWSALLLSTVFNLVNITLHWLCARAVGITLDLSFYFVVVPLLSLALLVPLSVGGLGSRDWIGQVFLTPAGIAQTTAAAWTLLLWAVTAAAGLVGGLLYLWEGVSGLARQRSEQRSGVSD